MIIKKTATRDVTWVFRFVKKETVTFDESRKRVRRTCFSFSLLIFRVRQRCWTRAEFCRWHYGSHTPGAAGVKSLVFEAFLVRDVFSVHRWRWNQKRNTPSFFKSQTLVVVDRVLLEFGCAAVFVFNQTWIQHSCVCVPSPLEEIINTKAYSSCLL